MSAWARREPRASPADSGSDCQVGEAWEARWTRPLADGTWAAVIRTVFIGKHDHGRSVECDYEYTICRDPAAPGDTELWSDDTQDSWPEAKATCMDPRRIAELVEAPDDEEWTAVAPAWAPEFAS